MKVCFLVHELRRSGGVDVILGHAERLAARDGIDVEIVLTRDPRPRLPVPAGVGVRALGEAGGVRYDVALATWWETAAALFAVDAGRRALFVQSFEQRFYEPGALFERLAASLVYALPVGFVVVGSWMRDLLALLHPGARSWHVPNGIDKGVFSPRERRPGEGPLRVLVEGQPSLWFKGVSDAVAAVRAMRRPAELTVVALDPSDAGELDAEVVGALNPAAMADLYARHDVLVKLSRVEGLGLGPVEAFHLGVPSVVTPYTGHEDYVVHGENGLVTGFDDVEGTARLLDLLAGDRDLLARLSAGALAMAGSWPDAQSSTDRLAGALEELLAEPEPKTAPALDGLFWELRLGVELGRFELEELRGSLAETRARADQLSRELEQMAAKADEAVQWAQDAERRLREIKESRAYRAAERARAVVNRIRP